MALDYEEQENEPMSQKDQIQDGTLTTSLADLPLTEAPAEQAKQGDEHHHDAGAHLKRLPESSR